MVGYQVLCLVYDGKLLLAWVALYDDRDLVGVFFANCVHVLPSLTYVKIQTLLEKVEQYQTATQQQRQRGTMSRETGVRSEYYALEADKNGDIVAFVDLQQSQFDDRTQ